MARRKKPTPKSQAELSQAQISPFIPGTKTPIVDSKARQVQRRVDNDTIKRFSVGLRDIDETIIYYFNNVIKPSVIQNGVKVNVPIVYGSPERWKSVQKDGFYRDKNGKIMTPLIMFKRDSLEKNYSITNKLDANNPHLYTSFQKAYNSKNSYSNFNVLNNRKPINQFIANVVPDYVTLGYSFIVQTYYIEQLNKIIEAINYSSDSYWGDPERFKFKSKIDTFNTITELNQGQDRVVRSTFSLKVDGYIIPDVIQKDIHSIKKYNSKSKVSFTTETTINIKTSGQ